MYAKPLVLTLLIITAVLAGCLESSDVDDTRITDTTDDVIVDDRSGIVEGNEVDRDEEIAPANPDDCNSGGGTWIEASERGGESYCDMGDENESSETGEITQEDCERRGGTWSEERSTCYFEEDREDDREITQEDCERRNGTWTAASDREGEFYCDFGENDRDDTDEDREITQEDCERRNGTWTATSDREGEFYCDFGDNDTPCDENMTCGDAVTCVDGFLYPSTCGDRNCDEPIGRCGAYASIIIVLSSWNAQHPNYSGLNDIFNSTQPIEIFGYLDENSNMEEATNEEARNYAEQYGINFSFTPLVGNEHGINSSDIEELPYYAASFSMSCDDIIENQIYDDFNGSYNAVIDFIDTWIDCTRSNGSENSQETESQSQRECEERGGTWVEERRECNDEENQ